MLRTTVNCSLSAAAVTGAGAGLEPGASVGEPFCSAIAMGLLGDCWVVVRWRNLQSGMIKSISTLRNKQQNNTRNCGGLEEGRSVLTAP